jgi:colicin import membrane protein
VSIQTLARGRAERKSHAEKKRSMAEQELRRVAAEEAKSVEDEKKRAATEKQRSTKQGSPKRSAKETKAAEEAQIKYLSVVSIQALARGRADRKILSEKKKQELLQKKKLHYFAAEQARIAEEANAEVEARRRAEAAASIQALARGRAERKAFAETLRLKAEEELRQVAFEETKAAEQKLWRVVEEKEAEAARMV